MWRLHYADPAHVSDDERAIRPNYSNLDRSQAGKARARVSARAERATQPATLSSSGRRRPTVANCDCGTHSQWGRRRLVAGGARRHQRSSRSRRQRASVANRHGCAPRVGQDCVQHHLRSQPLGPGALQARRLRQADRPRAGHSHAGLLHDGSGGSRRVCRGRGQRGSAAAHAAATLAAAVAAATASTRSTSTARQHAKHPAVSTVTAAVAAATSTVAAAATAYDTASIAPASDAVPTATDAVPAATDTVAAAALSSAADTLPAAATAYDTS